MRNENINDESKGHGVAALTYLAVGIISSGVGIFDSLRYAKADGSLDSSYDNPRVVNVDNRDAMYVDNFIVRNDYEK